MFFFFGGGNPTLEMDKGKIPHFPFKRVPLPLVCEEKRREDHGSPPSKNRRL